MRILATLLFCLSLSAQSLTLKTAVASKPDAYWVTIPNVTIAPGNVMIAVVGIDSVGITGYTWRGAQIVPSTGAANFGKGGRQYTSGVRTFTFISDSLGGTGDLRFDFSRESYGIVIAVFESSVHGPDSGVGAPVGGWAGPTSNPSAGPLPWQNSTTEFLLASLATEGPASDAPGAWPSGWTDCGRWGTVGGSAASNITLSVGCRVVTEYGPYSVSKAGVTPRYWALSLGSYIP